MLQLEPGDVVGPYCIDERVHQGRVAAVFRATHQTLGSSHALKTTTLTSSSAKERLVNEGKLLATLSHRNLVVVTDILPLGDGVATVMAYVDGPSLAEWRRSTEPAFDNALEIFVGIARGLREIHRAGIIHGHITSDNVLLVPLADKFLPRICGFSLSHDARPNPDTDPARRSTGDVRYAAPEQFADSRRVTKAADVYSLGCVLHEMLLGRLPHDGEDAFAIQASINEGLKLPTTLSHNTRSLLLAMLEPDPERRINDASLIVDWLRPFTREVTSANGPAWRGGTDTLKTSKTKAPEPSPGLPWSPAPANRPTAPAVVAIAALTLIGMSAGFVLAWMLI